MKMIHGAGQRTGLVVFCFFFLHKNFQNLELQRNTEKFQMENKIRSCRDLFIRENLISN